MLSTETASRRAAAGICIAKVHKCWIASPATAVKLMHGSSQPHLCHTRLKDRQERKKVFHQLLWHQQCHPLVPVHVELVLMCGE